MKKRQHSPTSKEAHDSVKPFKQVMYQKIEAGLLKLRAGGTSHEIAAAAGLEVAQVHKRLPEMIELGIVFNVGINRPTPSGRKSMVRQLTALLPKTTKQLKLL